MEGQASAAAPAAPAAACASGEEMLKLQRWAVVGRASNDIVQKLLMKLKGNGKDVLHVDPYSNGEGGVPTALTQAVDVVDLCAKPSMGEEVVKACVTLGVNNVFIQPGACNENILAACKGAGITSHEGCVLREMVGGPNLH
mmetsp:Transcript_23419/g.35342  ORF Transcript_23419/g.35342 Transcript_23419/m.35342 type:complete len:141 (+) Transcript_23419:148-570(+)